MKNSYYKSADDVRTFQEALDLLRLSEERYRLASENSSEIIFDYDVETNSIYHVSNQVEVLLGVPQIIDNAPQYLVECGAVCAESAELFLSLFEKVRAGAKHVEGVIHVRAVDGTFLWCNMIFTSIFDDAQQPIRAVGVLRNITRQREAELQCENETLFHDAMRKDSILTYEADLTSRKILNGHQKWLELLHIPYTDGYDPMVGVFCDYLVYRKDHTTFRETLAAESLLLQYAEGCTKIGFECRRLLDSGEITWVSCAVYLLEDGQSGHIKAFFYMQDINEVKQKELDLQKKAERDLLTGLYNKGTTEKLIHEALAEPPENEPGICAFFIVDLDDFKAVNDQLGHAFGDAILSETAHSLRSICRTGDIAGRIGGDEFVLFFKNLPSARIAEEKATKLCAVFRDAYASILKNYKVSSTIGVSLSPRDGTTFDALYRKADLALYSAKKRGKDTWAFYQDTLKTQDIATDAPASIDRSSGKSFSENIIEYLFRILYESHDLHIAISAILELVSKHFGCCRGYIYELGEDGGCHNTFEWCASGTAPLPDDLKAFYGAEVAYYKLRFETNRLYAAAAAENKTQKMRTQLEQRGVKAQLQYALMSNGVFRGFIGFDKDDAESMTMADDLSALQAIAQMLDVFLSERRGLNKLAESERILKIISDKQNICTYLINPDTYTLRFINSKTEVVFPQAIIGTLCYKTLRGNTSPCEDCPIRRMQREGTKSDQAEIFNTLLVRWFKVDSSLVQMEDSTECGLINAYDITEYKNRADESPLDADAFTSATVLYNALCRSTDDYIYMCDVPNNVFYFPKEMVEEFCLPGQLVVNAAPIWAARLHDGEREEFTAAFAALLDGTTSVHCQDYRALNRENKWVWLRCRGYLEHSDSGEPSLFAGIISHLPVSM